MCIYTYYIYIHRHLYIYVYVYIYMHIIYIYIERERGGPRETDPNDCRRGFVSGRFQVGVWQVWVGGYGVANISS